MQTADQHTTFLAADDLLGWATTETGLIKTLVLAVASVMVLAGIVTAYWKSKSWVATAVAMLLGAFLLYGINNMGIFQTKVGNEIDKKGAISEVTVPVGHLSAPAAMRDGLLQ